MDELNDVLRSLNRLLNRLLERRKAAIEAACNYSDTRTCVTSHRELSRQRGYEKGGMIVEVAYGNRTPPARVWYIVGDDGSILGELSRVEVEGRFGRFTD